MEESFEISKVLAIVAPIIVIQFILMIIALILCVKAEQTRGPKFMWVLIILLIQLFGPIAFFIFGRRNEK
ncbi:PLDc_N domain-containing protein [Paenibacillus sp. GSMTC-2017]|nr:PLD nuclease N-terminal domain-containing protein [Paenibacillus sp. GSMTC-2017]MBH5320162.1 PLDc_N domain-containing protein [Paenibacillus sp. GSMTC-2017]